MPFCLHMRWWDTPGWGYGIHVFSFALWLWTAAFTQQIGEKMG